MPAPRQTEHKNARRTPGRRAPSRPRRAAKGPDNGHSGSGGWQGGNTSGADCSEAPFPCRTCCGCPARRGAGAGPVRQVHTAPRPRWPAMPASCGGGYRWTGPRDSGASLRHTARPAPAKTCRTRTRLRSRRFFQVEYRRQYFSGCGPLLHGSASYRSCFFTPVSSHIQQRESLARFIHSVRFQAERSVCS